VIFYYLDASAWVKRYHQELGTRWVQDLFAQNPTVACASLGLIEVMATLTRKRKAREIDPASFQQKVQELEEDWERFIQIQMTAEVVDTAKDLARSLALRGADSVHLASAVVLQKRFTDDVDRLILITSDHELKEATPSSGLTVVDPEEEEKKATSQANDQAQEEDGA
jgi:predicted nucleic acid-binding protein